ncbi:hypothetical protein QQP08_002556 [Theobroma cacao]|nr:hypothetical protein QQP08_002556 [Theobroma cacao]
MPKREQVSGSARWDDRVSDFLTNYDVDPVCLAHQVVEDGQDCFPDTSQPVTILSAPNYCGEFDNAGQLGRLDCWTHNIFSCEGQREIYTVKWLYEIPRLGEYYCYLYRK